MPSFRVKADYDPPFEGYLTDQRFAEGTGKQMSGAGLIIEQPTELHGHYTISSWIRTKYSSTIVGNIPLEIQGDPTPEEMEWLRHAFGDFLQGGGFLAGEHTRALLFGPEGAH